MMTKAFLRKEFLAKRMLLSEAVQQQQTEKIAAHFTLIALAAPAFVLSYKGLVAKQEVNPIVIEKAIIQQSPNCRLCYPKIAATGNSMEAIELAESHPMRNNKWGITEPTNGKIISPQQIDVILVPLLCFDRSGYRVGYGKGFYDRYIARCRPDVIIIGLSFFEPVDRIEDADEYDVPMKYCVTPHQVYQF